MEGIHEERLPAPRATDDTAGSEAHAEGGEGEFTCPMHPEIVREAPGACPICGMALEPRSVPAEAEEENPELRDMKRRVRNKQEAVP